VGSRAAIGSEAQVDIEGGGKLRILVVEDEPIARELLADLLTMAGYDVVSVRTGEQGLLTLIRERGRFDCLFTAVELPGLVDGWMLADELRVGDSARPVVFAASAEPARPLEGTAFVSCPVLPPIAVEAVKAATGRSEAALRARRAPAPVAMEPAAPVLAEAACEADSAVGLLRAAG
jgi:CheY-like chemotaxis protein